MHAVKNMKHISLYQQVGADGGDQTQQRWIRPQNSHKLQKIIQQEGLYKDVIAMLQMQCHPQWVLAIRQPHGLQLLGATDMGAQSIIV